eukprot:6048118-Amphidinium_carterae.1
MQAATNATIAMVTLDLRQAGTHFLQVQMRATYKINLTPERALSQLPSANHGVAHHLQASTINQQCRQLLAKGNRKTFKVYGATEVEPLPTFDCCLSWLNLESSEVLPLMIIRATKPLHPKLLGRKPACDS